MADCRRALVVPESATDRLIQRRVAHAGHAFEGVSVGSPAIRGPEQLAIGCTARRNSRPPPSRVLRPPEPVPQDLPAVYLNENALDSTVSFPRGCDLCRPLLPADAGRERIRVRDVLHVAGPDPLGRVRRRNGGHGYDGVGPVRADVVAEQAVSSALGADGMPANESVLAGRYGAHHRDVRLAGIYG